MDAPRVSIVVPTYARLGYLNEALASVERQTYGDFEILVCDNAADPQTAEAVAGLRDPRVRYVPRATNVGLFRNAIEGFAAARGDYVMKLDDDDALEPDALATLVEPLDRHPQVTLAFGGLSLVGPAGESLDQEQADLDDYSGRTPLVPGLHRPFTALAARGTVPVAAALLRRSAVDWGRIPPAVATAYDLHLALNASKDRAAAYYLGTRPVRYRRHPASDTSTAIARQVRGRIAGLDDALRWAHGSDRAVVEKELSLACLRLGRDFLRAGDIDAGRELLRHGLRVRRSMRSARLLALSYAPPSVLASVLDHRRRAFESTFR